MKHKVIITAVIALTINSQFVTAGSIADTYATGDTLTAAKMDTIKNAVNDNDGNTSINTGNITANTGNISANTAAIATKQDRVTGTCPVGQSIRVINSNGTVSCGFDTNTTYSAGSGLSLSGTTFSLDVNPAFRAVKNVSQTFSSTVDAVVSFGTEQFDNGGNYNPSTSTFVVPQDGFYHFTCSILPSVAFTGNARLSIGVDMVQVYPPWAAFQTITVTTDKFFTAATPVTCNFFDNSTAENTIPASGFSRFTGYLVR